LSLRLKKTSSRTIEDQPSSRYLEHFKGIQEIKQLIGNRLIVFDRQFFPFPFAQTSLSSG